MDHDRAHGGDLLHTLRSFLEVMTASSAAPRLAASSTSTHGTVYRVRRIQELLGVDLGDPAAVFDITLALRILDLLGETTGEPATSSSPAAALVASSNATAPATS